VMHGTLRTFDDGVREQILRRLAELASDMARAYRTEAKLVLGDMRCPTVINTEKETELVRRCAVEELGEAAVGAFTPVMASDDVCWFLRARPGCYFRVGIAPTHGRPAPHHAPEFEMNEEGLPIGLRTSVAVMRRALARA
jgi:metal-dependent amidase/aminoacylase/carboxypeptidase family protein